MAEGRYRFMDAETADYFDALEQQYDYVATPDDEEEIYFAPPQTPQSLRIYIPFPVHGVPVHPTAPVFRNVKRKLVFDE